MTSADPAIAVIAAMDRSYPDRVSPRRMVSAQHVAATVPVLVAPAGRSRSARWIGARGTMETL